MESKHCNFCFILHLLVLLVLQVGDLLSTIFVCIMRWHCQELMQGGTAPVIICRPLPLTFGIYPYPKATQKSS